MVVVRTLWTVAWETAAAFLGGMTRSDGLQGVSEEGDRTEQRRLMRNARERESD